MLKRMIFNFNAKYNHSEALKSNNLTIFLISAILFAAILISPASFSAGSGGGGSGGSGGNAEPVSCSQDFFKCTDWSLCQKDGKKTRTCSILSDCQNVSDPKPLEEATCAYVSQIVSSLKCFNFDTLKERVDCRLGLAEEELQKELQIQYLPEECRQLKNDGEKEDCMKTYSDSQVCWRQPIGEKRHACLKQLFGITNITGQKADCGNNTECIVSLKKKVYSLAKFRLYDLEERAEGLLKEGKISNEKATEIISALEQKKIEFNNAATKEHRKQVLIDAKNLWKNFMNEIKK